jgi:hypothetical protein
MLTSVRNGRESADQLADALALTLEEIRAVITPILGPLAVTALYRRCLHLCAAKHPCFESLHKNEDSSINPSSVRAMLAQLSNTDDLQLGDELINTFYTLLASLIGPSLTEQLMGDCTASARARNDHQSDDT